MTVSTGTVAECGDPGPGKIFYACEKNGIVHTPNPCDYANERFAELLCHEQAHLAHGWPADHGE